jgi:hypothetical protein
MVNCWPAKIRDSTAAWQKAMTGCFAVVEPRRACYRFAAMPRRPLLLPRLCIQLLVLPAVLTTVACTGCGKAMWSDSKRAATQQLLISDAIERTVMKLDLQPLAGRKVFLETTVLSDVDDAAYLSATLQHQMLDCGCVLAEKREDAEIVLQARAGALGTDRSEVLIGIPATQVEFVGNGTTLPEIALAKKTDQRAVAKISLFAYWRDTGLPVWQSGSKHVASDSRSRWFLGAGPFQNGPIHDRTEFAGSRILIKPGSDMEEDADRVATAATINEPYLFPAAGLRSDVVQPAESMARERPLDLPAVR